MILVPELLPSWREGRHKSTPKYVVEHETNERDRPMTAIMGDG